MTIDWLLVFTIWGITVPAMFGAFYLGVYVQKWQDKRKIR